MSMLCFRCSVDSNLVGLCCLPALLWLYCLVDVFVTLLCVQPYMAVFPPLLTPVFWERHGNVPALSRLLVAYLTKAGSEIAAGGEAT
jgi:hypothetical protein